MLLRLKMQTKQLQTVISTKLLLIGVIVHFACWSGAVGVGPQLSTEKQPERAPHSLPQIRTTRLDIPDLDIAVVVLDPNLIESDKKMREKGVWPEVRKVESIRSAVRIKESLEALKQFDNVMVAPSLSVSSDLYLQGKIERSTTEEMKIRWRLMDARGATWINWKNTDYRIQLGWHDRFYSPGVDAFRYLYDRIAKDVHNQLHQYAKKHASQHKKNQRLIKRGKKPTKISDLDEITHVRDLVMARFFAPKSYKDTLKENSKKEYELEYIPDTQSEEWINIQSFARRDRNVAQKFDEIYAAFFNQVNESYENWLNEIYPFARETRVNKVQSRTNLIVGSLVLLATAGAGLAETDTGVQDRILAAGGIVGGALVGKGLMDRADYKENLALFDEMSRDYHESFKPTNVQIEGQVVTLSGTAAEQFSSWRQLLQEGYEQTQSDTFEVEIVDSSL